MALENDIFLSVFNSVYTFYYQILCEWKGSQLYKRISTCILLVWDWKKPLRNCTHLGISRLQSFVRAVRHSLEHRRRARQQRHQVGNNLEGTLWSTPGQQQKDPMSGKARLVSDIDHSWLQERRNQTMHQPCHGQGLDNLPSHALSLRLVVLSLALVSLQPKSKQMKCMNIFLSMGKCLKWRFSSWNTRLCLLF